MLRDPVSRYLSEWKHVQRGATWKTSLHMCDGRSPTPDELPTCYEGDDWSGVSLQEFMDCSYNLANNRQVRMLADLSLVGCYNLTFMNESERNMILLQSAKNNLKNMAFFGLTEFQRKTQYLFERTFNLKFISPFTQFNVTRASNVDIGEDVRQRIEELNFLDVQLYEYAKDLFLQRFQYSKQEEHQKNRLKRREERRLLREQRAHQSPREEAAEVAVTEDYNSQVARWWCSSILTNWWRGSQNLCNLATWELAKEGLCFGKWDHIWQLTTPPCLSFSWFLPVRRIYFFLKRHWLVLLNHSRTDSCPKRLPSKP